MNITGLVIARLRDIIPATAATAAAPPVTWDSALNGTTLLGQALASLRAMPYLSETRVLTDCPELAARGQVDGAAVCLLPGWFFEYGVPFFSKEQWLLTRAMQALESIGARAQVLLLADWRTPLVQPRTLETLYHKLMDDRVAARSVGIYPLDPNLFLRMGEEKFFPVWADLGADRQTVPQLYRNIAVGAVRPDRLVTHSPETRGVPVSREEGLRMVDHESLALARFYLQRREGGGCPPHFGPV